MIPAKVNAIHRLRRRSAVHLNWGIYPTSLSEYLEAPFISDTLGVVGNSEAKKSKTSLMEIALGYSDVEKSHFANFLLC